MNKILLFLFVTLIGAVNAQFTIDQDSVYDVFDTNESDIAVHNTQQTFNPVITMKWEIVSVSVPTNWENDFFICDAIQCWDSLKNENEYDLPDNKLYPLDCHFLNNGNAGVGIAKIRIWEVGDSANSAKIVTFEAEIEEAVGLSSIDKINLAIYPNPASNFIKIENIKSEEINKIEIYNIIGLKVKEINNPQNNESINIANLEKGVYIIMVTDKKHNNYSRNFTKN